LLYYQYSYYYEPRPAKVKHIDVMAPLHGHLTEFFAEQANGVTGGGVKQQRITEIVESQFFGMIEATSR